MFLHDPTARLLEHHGLSTALQIVAVSCGLLGQLLMTLKRRLAFWVWIVSNGALMALNVALHLWWLVAMYAVYSALCVLGLWTWRQPKPAEPLDITSMLPGAEVRRP